MSSSEKAFNDELLSAYLDGELTGPERDRVAQRLAEHAEDRRKLEDLRALRIELQSLPGYRLDDQFHLRVLRRAEQETLEVSSEVQSPTRLSSPATPADADAPFGLQRLRNLRLIVWPVVAVAAALLLMFLSPGDLDEEPGLAGGPGSSAVGRPTDQDPAIPLRLDSNAVGDSPGKSGGVAGRGSVPDSETGTAVDDDVAPTLPAARTRDVLKIAAPRSEPDAANEPVRQRPSAAVSADTAPRDRSRRSDSAKRMDDASAETVESGSYVDSIVEALDDEPFDMIVQLGLSQVDTANQTFDGALARNNIQFDPAGPQPESAPGFSYGEPATAESSDGRASFGVQPAVPELSEIVRQNVAAAGDLQLVYVQAPADQIQATVADLQNYRQYFPEISLYVAANLDLSHRARLGATDSDGSAKTGLGTKSRQLRRQLGKYEEYGPVGRPPQSTIQTLPQESADMPIQNFRYTGQARRLNLDETRRSEGQAASEGGIVASEQYLNELLDEARKIKRESQIDEKKEIRQETSDAAKPPATRSLEAVPLADTDRWLEVLFILSPQRPIPGITAAPRQATVAPSSEAPSDVTVAPDDR